MPLKLMYITNNPEIAVIAEGAGVDRIFVDMEYIGKEERQAGLDAVKNRHTVEDVARVRSVLKKAELLVRVNPVHDKTDEYPSTEQEIEEVISAGADVIMLPFFKTVKEVERFLKAVNGRVKTNLLLETPEAVEILDDIIKLKGFDEIHIGLNDLSIGYKKTFMFELLADGTVEKLCAKLKNAGITYGFGGIASLGRGLLTTEYVIKEHYRFGSKVAILSRSFCNANALSIEEVKRVFALGVKEIRDFEKACESSYNFLTGNGEAVEIQVDRIVDKMVMQKKG